MARACSIHTLRSVLSFVLAYFLFGSFSSWADGFEELYRFRFVGIAPSGLVRGPGGYLYGVTNGGGTMGVGSLFRLKIETGEVETLASFSSWISVSPTNPIVVDQSSNVFGVSYNGIIWRWNSVSGLMRVGAAEEARATGSAIGFVADEEGGLIGVSYLGGDEYSSGVLWRWHPSTGAQRLADFAIFGSSSHAFGSIVRDSQGAVYGLLQSSGYSLWRWTAAHGLEKVAALNAGYLGWNMGSLTVDAAGRVWGTTISGGPHEGSLWRWTEGLGVEKLGDFDRNAGLPPPKTPVTFSPDGTAYGVSDNVIWKWTSETGLVRHAYFNTSIAGYPEGPFVIDETGAFFGASPTIFFGEPMVWKWREGTDPVVLKSFGTQTNPNAGIKWGVVKDAQGRFYGISRSDGRLFSPEILWRWSPESDYEVLAEFRPAQTGSHLSHPIIDSAGNIFSLTSGTVSVGGILWRWNQESGLVKLAVFPLEGGYAGGVIVPGRDGQIYGIRGPGGANAVIWKWTAADGIVNMAELPGAHSFLASCPSSGADLPLLGASVSFMYGIPTTLWSWSEENGLQTLGSLSSGDYPSSSMVRDSAGNIYGTISGATPRLWKWNADSGTTYLGAFDAVKTGTSPMAICLDADGIIRGTCAEGGVYAAGTIWSWKEGGEICAIHHFDSETGASKALNLDVDVAGNVTGVSTGAIWRLTDTAAPIAATGAVLQNDGVAIILGAVDAKGDSATVSIEYGTDPENLSVTTPVSPANVSGIGATPVTATLTGLPKRRTFFARFVASNSRGTAKGNLVTFTTPNLRPTGTNDRLHAPPVAAGPFLVDVLANDDGKGDELILNTVGSGQTAIQGNKILYTPGPDYRGSDVFGYSVRTDFGGSFSAFAEIYNSEPELADDIVAHDAGPVTFDPLANDSDADGDPLAISSVTQPSHGSVSFTDTSITYTPEAGFTGTDRFTYSVTDGRTVVGPANVEVRPREIFTQEVLSVGTTFFNRDGNFEIKRIGAAGSVRDGLLLTDVQSRGKTVKALINTRTGAFVLKVGDILPGPENIVVKGISEPAGRAFLLTLAVNKPSYSQWKVIAYYDPLNGLQAVARTGDVMFDTALLDSFTGFGEANGSVFMLGNGRTRDRRRVQVLWSWKNGNRHHIAISAKDFKSFTTLVPAPDSPAAARWFNGEGHLIFRANPGDSGQSICIFREITFGILAESGNSSPIQSTYRRFGMPAIGPDPYSFAFRSTDAKQPSGSVSRIYGSLPENFLDSIVSEGAVIDSEPDTVIRKLGDPIVGEYAKYAVIGEVAGSAGGKGIRSLLWFDGRAAKVVAREGDPLPGGEAGKIGRIKSFVLPLKTARGPIFTATAPGGLGLFASNEAGQPLILAKPGISLTVGGVTSEVRSLRALEGISGPACGPRGYDDYGRVEAIVKFTDGSESLIYFSLP